MQDKCPRKFTALQACYAYAHLVTSLAYLEEKLKHSSPSTDFEMLW